MNFRATRPWPISSRRFLIRELVRISRSIGRSTISSAVSARSPRETGFRSSGSDTSNALISVPMNANGISAR